MNSKEKIAQDLLELTLKKYGVRLDTQGHEEVKKGVEAIAEAIVAMRNLKLKYSDEPSTTFKPFEKED
ncbi:hypothetical protein KEJ47_01975 [Candidatus Bathyarchaeota archaeon]|nr:hypothetical protein [Candidatus Bathyarchaeota archaeon]